MTTYGTIEIILLRLSILATNNRGKTLAEFETETRRRIYEENKRREREAWEKAWNQLNNYPKRTEFPVLFSLPCTQSHSPRAAFGGVISSTSA